MKLLATTILFLLTLVTFAQSFDTLYYDKNWKDCEKELAFYYGFKDLDTNYSGVEQYYYLNGKKHSVKEVKNGSEDGTLTWWYKNGQKWCVGQYSKGKKHGKFVYWYPNGVVKEEGTFNNDKRVGGWISYDKHGLRIYGKDIDQEPLYSNARNHKKSIKLLAKHIEVHTNYPKEGKENKLEGRVVVSFTIDEKGNVVDIDITESVNPYLDKKAVKIIESLEQWKPGSHQGKAVRVRYSLPIRFQLHQP